MMAAPSSTVFRLGNMADNFCLRQTKESLRRKTSDRFINGIYTSVEDRPELRV